jgi:eukaryotic-like serine/threonine-protein kinase
MKRDGHTTTDPMLGDTLVGALAPAQDRAAGGDLQVGDLLRDTYRILGLLASGGTGNVYLADHVRLPGRVAVKTLRGERLQDSQSLARFRAEAEITASLRHPHIVQTLDFDVSPAGRPYLVMELCEGPDLRSLVERGPTPVARVAEIVRQIASALQLAHDHGIVHRDLKPANVMLVNTGADGDFVKLVDFGLSKLLLDEGPPVTSPDQILGTPGYMAPEQVRGGRVDARVDQFALASLSYQLLTGRAPFAGDDVATVLRHIVSADPLPIWQLVPGRTRQVSLVVARGLAKTPAQRYASVSEYDQALRAAVAEDAAHAAAQAASGGDRPEALDIAVSYRW